MAEQAKDEVEADSEYELVRTRKSNKSLQSNMSDEDRTVRSRHSMEPSGMNSGDDFADSGMGYFSDFYMAVEYRWHKIRFIPKKSIAILVVIRDRLMKIVVLKE